MAYNISLLSVRPGGSPTPQVEALQERYLRRCGPVFTTATKIFRSADALLTSAAEMRRQGAAALWLADLGGLGLTSEDFAERLRQSRDSGLRHLMLAIGPADGWSAEARKQADLRLSLGPMTLPHELAALVLAEQIYRASTILQGHPYHLGH